MKKLIFLISCLAMFSACGVEVLQDYGVDSIVFPESRQDTINIKGSIMQDSVVTSIAVHRSGVSPSYPAKTIGIIVNTDSVTAVINKANTAITPSTEQLWFKGVIVLPATCFTVQSPILMPANSRTAPLTVTLIKSEIDKLDKSKVYLTAFSISPANDITIIKENNINFLKIVFK
jgi:hypothetical protein